MQAFKFSDEEYRFIKIYFLRKSENNFRWYLIFSFLSLGILPLLVKWFPNIKKRIYIFACNIEEATHVMLDQTNKKTFKIKELRREQVILIPHRRAKLRIFFNYKRHFYYASQKSNLVKSLKGKFLDRLKRDRRYLEISKNGLSNSEALKILRVYKKNAISIKVESIFTLFFRIIFTPFSLFQVFSISLWLIDDYFSFAFLILIMMAGSIAMDIYEIRSEAIKIRDLAHHEVGVQLFRSSVRDNQLSQKSVIREKANNNLSDSEDCLLDLSQDERESTSRFQFVSSFKITVGDVIEIKTNEVIPSDVILIEGKCLVDESTLTGETVPILKASVDKNGNITDSNYLSAGTSCINAFNAKGIVIATGFYSKKGELVRSLLLADHIEFKFQHDSLKFVMVTVMASILGAVWFIVFIAMGKYSEYYTWSKMVIKSLEIFTVGVPPALLLCLAIGNTIANRRLKRQQIFTCVLQKINEAGRIACVCFDKTGTLTMNKLVLQSIIPVYDGQAETADVKYSEREDEEEGEKYRLFDVTIESGLREIYSKHRLTEKGIYKLLILTMGTCHSLSFFEKKVIGDPMELQLFEESGFRMEERCETDNFTGKTNFETYIKPSDQFLIACHYESDFEYHILRRFDFSSDRKRMSSIIENHIDKMVRIITKGAPEIIKSLCDFSSLPFNFDEILEELTEQGLRVIAIGSKVIADKREARNSDASDLEKNLEFLGFFCFKNPLKEDTASTIEILGKCKINCRMITGDNLLTATSVGIATGIIQRSHAIFSATVKENEVFWEQLENEDERSIRHTSAFSQDLSGVYLSRKSSENSSEGEASELHQERVVQIKVIQSFCERKICSIVMNGEAFDIMFSENWENNKFLRLVLEASVIFARTSPDQKAQIVERIQKWYKLKSTDNWFVGFCGDGANDCSALKKADVGLSLSETEASIAAPFNTTIQNISSMIPLLREGKASLETAFMNFKYILYYSFIQFFALLAVYQQAGEFANGHYYYMDIMVFLPLSIFICGNGTIESLNKHFPKSSLMKPEVLFEIFGHIALAGIAFWIFNDLLDRYPECLTPNAIVQGTDINAELQYNPKIFGFFILCVVLNSVGALVFNRGFPFKVHPSKNLPLILHSSLTLGVTVFILFADMILPSSQFLYVINKIFRELRFDGNLIRFFATYTLIVSLCCLVFEKVIIPYFKEYMKKRIANQKKEKGIS